MFGHNNCILFLLFLSESYASCVLTWVGTAEHVSRDQILRRERGQRNINFPCSADHVQDWQPYPVDLYIRYLRGYSLASKLLEGKNTRRNDSRFMQSCLLTKKRENNHPKNNAKQYLRALDIPLYIMYLSGPIFPVERTDLVVKWSAVRNH